MTCSGGRSGHFSILLLIRGPCNVVAAALRHLLSVVSHPPTDYLSPIKVAGDIRNAHAWK